MAWLARTGRPPIDAVEHFWPGVTDQERRNVLAGRVRGWAFKARRAAERAPVERPPPAPPKHAAPPPPGTTAAAARVEGELLGDEDGDGRDVPRPAIRPEVAQLDRVEWLEQALVELDADVRWARESRKLALVPKLHSEIRAVRDELDEARADRQKIKSIDRSPAAVADEVTRRAEVLRRLRERREQQADPRRRDL